MPDHNEKKQVNEAQRERFIEAARKLETDDDPEAFKRRLKKLVEAPPPKSIKERQSKHASDCAVHNGPAMPAGPCDCGAD